jgi:predicted nucleic acid-binding protein
MEKEALVLDASVIVKWFCEEEYTDIALGIRKRFFNGVLNVVVPELMFYEVSNAIRYNEVLSMEEKLELIDDNVYLAVGRFKRCNLITADRAFRDKVNTNEVVFIGELE